MRSNPLIVIALAACVAAPASAQRDGTVLRLSATAVRLKPWGTLRNRVARTGLTIRHVGAPYRLDLSSRIGTWRIDAAKVLAVASRADTLYLLADVRGRSRANDGSGHCGAGTEGDLVWAKLAAGKAVALRAAPYASCWRDIGTQDDEHPAYSVDRDSLWMDEQLVGRPGRVRIRYWFRDPARGMQATVDTAKASSAPR
ncbi:MAG TPA: hypothetical protein VJT85_09050 [Gemmatimonadaceae bacterium]|nr:hypothetical protein [Gemmatimonadaceae bacterium]